MKYIALTCFYLIGIQTGLIVSLYALNEIHYLIYDPWDNPLIYLPAIYGGYILWRCKPNTAAIADTVGNHVIVIALICASGFVASTLDCITKATSVADTVFLWIGLAVVVLALNIYSWRSSARKVFIGYSIITITVLVNSVVGHL